MLQNKTILYFKKNDREYQLILDNSSPLGEVYDVLQEMKCYVVDRINSALKAEAKPQQEPNSEGQA